MALLTAAEMTNLYLYGSLTPPADLTAESLTSRPTTATTPTSVDINEYMAGPGRFASAAFFEILKQFFSPTSPTIPPGTYTESQMRSLLGVSEALISLQQWAYDDGNADYAARTYMWNTTAFEIFDGAQFVVNADGSRYVDNFAIIPFSNTGTENFDFDSSDPIAIIGNPELSEIVDPSSIGRTVVVSFTGSRPTTRLQYVDFQQAQSLATLPNITLLTSLRSTMFELTDQLFANGASRALFNDKPILYGTNQNDTIGGTVSVTETDIAEHRQLDDYAGNGVVYVAGAGADTVSGTAQGDVLIGGQGRDTLRAHGGQDVLDGVDGGQSDIMEGGVGSDTYYVDNGDFVLDDDGIGSVFHGASRVRLTGGSRHQGDTFFVSPDQTILYEERPNGTIFAYTPSGRVVINGPSHSSRDGLIQAGGGDLITGLVAMGLPLLTLRGQATAVTPSIPQEIAGTFVFSPIVLDMDRDGTIETRGIGEGGYFDYEGDGFRQQTGWAGSDDGLLVQDKNGDGLITTGAELFGNQTLLNSGEVAANGYQALGELDDNSDGRVDASDSAWSSLRVWQDSDADGQTDAGELMDLTAAGIRSLNVSASAGSGRDANGNDHRLVSQFTWTDGATGSSTDVWFTANLTSSLQQEVLPLTEDVAALPELIGYGTTFDLRQAIVRDGTGDLAALVNQFSNENDHTERMGIMEEIILEWTGADDVVSGSRGWYANAQHTHALEQFIGFTYETDVAFNQASFIESGFSTIQRLYYYELMKQTHYEQLFSQLDFSWDTATERVVGNLSEVTSAVIEIINQDPDNCATFLTDLIFALRASYQNIDWETSTLRDAIGLVDAELLTIYDQGWVTTLGTSGLDNLYGTDADEILSGLEGRDWIEGRGGEDALNGNEGHDTLFGGTGDDVLDGGEGSDRLFGGSGADTYLFGTGSGLDSIYTNDLISEDVLRFGAGISSTDVSVSRTSSNGTQEITGLLLRINQNDHIIIDRYFDETAARIGTVAQFQFDNGMVWTHQDILDRVQPIGTEGDNFIYGFDTDDFIYGLGGNDTLVGVGGNDFLSGGTGGDNLYGWAGNDTLDGGAGSDLLTGGPGDDVFVYGRGGGQDLIIRDSSVNGDENVIRLGQGIAVVDIHVVHTNMSLGIGLSGTEEQIVLNNWLLTSSSYGYGDLVTRIEFADGTIWTSVELLAASTYIGNGQNTDSITVVGTVGNDVLTTITGFDTLSGLAGDDILSSGAGNDTLYGGDGDDQLFGGGHADTLYGDASSDILDGGESGDMLHGGDGNDELYGRTGDDTLHGDVGNDLLDGGAGLDTLYGGTSTTDLTGDDTYVFGRGYGEDHIFDVDSAGGIDTIRLQAGITPADIILSRSGNARVLQIAGTNDSIAIEGWYFNPSYRIERVEFANGEIWDADELTGVNYIDGDGNNNYLNGTTDPDRIRGFAGNDTLQGYAGNDLLEGGDDSDQLYGGDGADQLQGGSGLDFLVGGLGADVFNGDAGDDNLSDEGGSDTYVLERGGGHDGITDQGSVGDLDTVSIAAGIAEIDVRVFQRNNEINIQIIETGDSLRVRNWHINPSYRIEQVVFADGIVWSGFDQGSYAIVGDELDNIETGSNLADVAHLEGGNDFVDGRGGNDLLDGGTGADTMYGGAGDDVFVVDNEFDGLLELAGEGTDVVHSSITWNFLNANIENIVLTGMAAINARGNELNNVIIGNSNANVINGLTGIDTLIGGGGDDIYSVDDGGDLVVENSAEGQDTIQSSVSLTLFDNVENLVLVGSGAINAAGNGLDNELIGNVAANVLDGGAGSDTMLGGSGNDTYFVDSVSDITIESAAEGLDAVSSSIYWTLSANIENLILTGTSAINGTGNALANALTGNAAGNSLDGGAGVDTMTGGLGNDQYVVDNTSDVVNESLSEGIDAVFASATYTLGANVDNLTLTGSLAVNGTGNTLDNIIIGNSVANALSGGAGNDMLNGGSGNDTLIGGIGNDSYIIDSMGDVVTEIAGEGTDTIQSFVTYTLGATLENLTLLGVSAINGTGNNSNNVLIGNSANNSLNGGSGNDTLDGGSGNDTLGGGQGNDLFVVDSASDVVTESSNQGTDTVQASLSWILGANLENLVLVGSTNLNATGNSLANSITGNAGNNTLSGGTGADQMSGGGGNDTYIVDNTSDTVTESLNEGIDMVQSSVAFTLGSNVDNLTLTNSSNVNGTGNGDANILVGNSGNNTLTGNGGNDTLDGGGAGTDSLVGSAGDDTYVVNRSSGITVTESAGNGFDTISASVSITTLAANIENIWLNGSTALNATGSSASNWLLGNSGTNTLTGNGGNDLLFGQGGTDTLTGNTGRELLIGGAGNDAITTNTGADIIAFNMGDGQDTVASSTTKDNVVSIGGGALYSDLQFKKVGNDLVLMVGASDQITFTGYYTSTSNRSVNTLQVVIDGTTDYLPGGGNATRDHRVERFNFDGLVTAFDAARTANPSLISWALTNALGANAVGGSDTQAFGGDAAYQYARNGNLSNLTAGASNTLLTNASFGTAVQTFTPIAGPSGFMAMSNELSTSDIASDIDKLWFGDDVQMPIAEDASEASDALPMNDVARALSRLIMEPSNDEIMFSGRSFGRLHQPVASAWMLAQTIEQQRLNSGASTDVGGDVSNHFDQLASVGNGLLSGAGGLPHSKPLGFTSRTKIETPFEVVL